MSEIKKFQDLVNQITSNELVLPDFQRSFVWKEAKMINLYASVLCRMPVGSILTLESDDAGFACKRIGAKTRTGNAAIEPDRKNITYLIDGQQRVTSLFAGFTTYFFDIYKDSLKNLSSSSLRNMFFVKIPANTSQSSEIDDLFGVKKLEFPKDILTEKKYYSTAEMREMISSEKSDVILGRKNSVVDIHNDNDLSLIEKYCTEEKDGAYHIPLQYIDNDDSKIQLSYDRILAKISDSYSVSQKKDENEDRRKIWQKNIQKYLSECLLTLKINQIAVENSNKSRAIDIYSNLNQGGAPLSVFDLVTAKVGGVKDVKYNYNDKVTECFTSPFFVKTDVLSLAPQQWIKNFQHKYDVIQKSGIIENGVISPQFIEVFLKVITFLITKENKPKEFEPKNLTKRDKILDLPADMIASKTENVCTAMKRAMCFFQTRFGIRKFSEINYKAEFGLVSFIFTDDELYNRIEIHDFLEYWYWISLFGYIYPTKQDISIYSEINKFLNFFNNMDSSRYAELKQLRKNSVLKAHNLTDEKTLTMENVSSGIVPPDKISTFICQFYLSQGYKDFHTDEELNFLSESVFGMHHIIPLGSDKKIGESTKDIRKNPYDIHNSPLNFIYITQTSNSDISDMKFSDYSQDEKVKTALASIHYNSVIDGVDISTFIKSRFKAVENELNNHLDSLEKSIDKNWNSEK